MPALTATAALDLSTRYIWRITGRRVDVVGAECWLDSPTTNLDAVGDEWLTAFERAGRVRAQSAQDGLLSSMSALDRPDFDSARIDPQVWDFYENEHLTWADVTVRRLRHDAQRRCLVGGRTAGSL